MSIPRRSRGRPWRQGSQGRLLMRRWTTAFAVTVLVGAALSVPARAQDDPQGGQGVEPGVTVAPSVEDEAAAERRLRMALVNAGAAWAAPAADLAAWLEARSRFMEASSLRRRVRGADPTTENCVLEARAVLGFAELVLASGGGGGGIKAAFEDARIALRRARESGADTIETALGLARSAAAQGNPQQEIVELEEALARWPDAAKVRRGLAFAYQNAERFDAATPLLRAVSDAAPDDLLLARALAYSARMAGDEKTAIAAAYRAIDAAPEAAQAWQTLWAIYAPEKRYGELANAILSRTERFPESAVAAHYAGFALSSARRTDEALTWLKRAWELSEGNHEARREAARLLITVKRDDAAAGQMYRRILELSPGHRGALDGLGFLAVKLGNEQRHDEALPYFRAVAEGLADDGRSWANLGLALRWAGRYDDAVVAYEKAVETSPDDAQLQNDFGLLLLVMKRDEDATRIFKATHEADPLANDCLENLGFMARERGDLAAATRWFKLAWDAAIQRGDATLIQRHRRNLDDVRFPLPQPR